MSLMESIRVALRSIRANKMRAFLTMLGIIIGVSAVIAMVAIGQGASSSVTNQIQGLGSNLLIVSPGQAQQGGAKLGAGSGNLLTLQDADSIAKSDAIAAVAPDITKQVQVSYRNTSYATQIEGTTSDYQTVRNVTVQAGRFFSKYEVKGESNVVVLGTEVVANLFPGENSRAIVGRKVEINGQSFSVIGVLESQGSSGPLNNDDRVLMPITTVMNRLLGTDKVRTIFVSASAENKMDQAQADITTALRTQHHLKPQDDNDFQITSQSQIL